MLARWRDHHAIDDFTDDAVYDICDEVEAALSVRTLPGAPIAASAPPARRRRRASAGRTTRSRDGCATTATTSRQGRRQSMTATYLPRAVAAGARMLAGHRVERLERHGPRATTARLRAADGTARHVRFGDVFVCGGAIQTPALLQRSGWRHHVGRTLAVHPTVKLAARFADEVNVPDDVPVHQVKEFAPDLSFGGSAASPGLVALALSDHWRPLRAGDHRLAPHRRVLRGDHQRGPGQGARRPGLARSDRHLPPHPPRPGAARAAAWPDWRW